MIYRAKHVECIYSPDSSDYLVVTFNGIGTRADGKRFWGDSFLKKNGISALGFVSKQRNWFPQESMNELCDVVRPILDRYQHRCTYGASMGAYGAIKYSKMLRADTVVAFSPQYTIDPSKEHAAFTHFFDRSLHQDVTIVPNDLGGRIVIFYDPYHVSDNYAARYIAGHGENVHLVPLPFIGHTTIFPFSKSSQGVRVLKLSIEGNIKGLRGLASDTRRRHGGTLRIYNMACRLVRRHVKWALAICEKYPAVIDEKRLEGLCQELKRWGKIPVAVAWARDLAVRNPDNSGYFKNLAGFLRFNNDFSSAKEAINRALVLEPTNHRYMLEFSSLAEGAGEIEEAILWGKKAVEAFPRDPTGFYHLALLLSKKGYLEEAIEILRQALEVHPNNNTFKIQMETWQKGRSEKLDDEIVAGLDA